MRDYYALRPDEIRYGRVYQEKKQLLKKNRALSLDEIKLWQMHKLMEILRCAYEDTDYYRQLFNENGIFLEDIKTIDDFNKIPFLTKEIVQNNIDKIVSKKYKKGNLIYGTTGGSTGTPLGLYFIKKFSISVEMAFVHDIWNKFDFETNKRHTVLRGAIIDSGLFESHGRTLFLSSYHLTDENMKLYVDKINEFMPKYIQAYPSSISTLCQFMQEHSLPPFQSVKMIMCSSENLLPFQKKLISDVLGVPICNLYGNTEHTSIASNCKYSDKLHFYPEYGYVEFLNNEGKECQYEGEIGEIVSTGFTNPAFPLIRYRSGDIITYTNNKCDCNWNYKIIKEVQGREQEFIITGTGRKICIAAINMHSNIFNNVRKFQFHQKKYGEVTLKYIAKESFSNKDEKNIYSELMQKMGNDVRLTLEGVDQIPLTKRGKQAFLIQELNIRQIVQEGRMTTGLAND